MLILKIPPTRKHGDKVEETTPTFIRRPILLGVLIRIDILMDNKSMYITLLNLI